MSGYPAAPFDQQLRTLEYLTRLHRSKNEPLIVHTLLSIAESVKLAQEARSVQVDEHNALSLREVGKLAKFKLAVEKSCSKCTFDEAEGGLIDHCNACCRRITEAAWEFIHS